MERAEVREGTAPREESHETRNPLKLHKYHSTRVRAVRFRLMRGTVGRSIETPYGL